MLLHLLLKIILKLVSDITMNDNLCIVAHSTSANDAIELCQNSKSISSLILIDPIDYLFFKNDFDFNEFNVLNLMNKHKILRKIYLVLLKLINLN